MSSLTKAVAAQKSTSELGGQRQLCPAGGMEADTRQIATALYQIWLGAVLVRPSVVSVSLVALRLTSNLFGPGAGT